MEITWSLHGDNPTRIVTGIPLEEAKGQDPIQMMGSSMVLGHHIRDLVSGVMCIDLVMCSLSLVGIELDPWQMTTMSPLWKMQQIWTKHLTHFSAIICPSLVVLNS